MREWIVEHDSECEITVNYNDNSECILSIFGSVNTTKQKWKRGMCTNQFGNKLKT